MSAEEHPKIWGCELWIVNNDNYCGKILEVKQGYQCSVHYHILKHETFYLLSGAVVFQFHDGCIDEKLLLPKAIVEVKQNHKHRFIGLAPLSQIIEFSTRHQESDSHRIIDSGKLSDEEFNELMQKYGNR